MISVTNMRKARKVNWLYLIGLSKKRTINGGDNSEKLFDWGIDIIVIKLLS